MTSRFDIELALSADAGHIAELSRESVVQGLPWRWTRPRVLACIRERNTNVVVARAIDRLVGFAIMKYGEEEASLLLFAVDPAYRRQRVGSDLLEWLELTARTAGLRAIRLEARQDNQTASAFYRHHGYEEIGVVHGYYQGLEDAVRFLKRL
ncbi:MAG TPA: GNAT family N-acetyltransferase [Steroidobacteraceae bacterium]|nr:GNAT family N-acetyltransferase [Steroidobacteraceae bacterium]